MAEVARDFWPKEDAPYFSEICFRNGKAEFGESRFAIEKERRTMGMRFKMRSPCLLLAVLLLLALPAVALAQVSVYAEGAYTATDLVVMIYADITGNPLCSFGVTLGYPTSKLTVASATKNETEWYFGTTGAKQPYMNPDTSTPGQIIFIGGKLDTGAPTAGVSGTRKLLGTATFNRVGGQDPPFAITLGLGKTHPPYDNFVTSVTPTAVLDGSVAFGTPAIWRRGDTNADGVVDVQDISAVRYYMINGGTPNPWKDCNGDGVIDVQDISCIRYIMTH